MNEFVIISISLVFSAFFSGMEIAFIASNRLRIELDKKQDLLSSKIVSIYTTNGSQFISTMLVGNNICLVIYGLVMAKVLEPVFLHFVQSETGLLTIQTIVSTLLILLMAEFLPKTLVRIKPNAVLNYLSLPAFIFYILFYPLTKSIIWFSNMLLSKVAKRNLEQKTLLFGKVDLDHLLNENSEETNEVVQQTENELKLFQNALDFSNVKVRECMIPRTEIIAVDVTTSLTELRKKFIETGFSKILVYKDTVDNMIGYITSKILFENPKNISSHLITILFIPETMAANKLLRKLIQQRKSLSVIVDEFGGISGMVTIEDIIEEIFGEIEDEHDIIDLTEKRINENEFIFSGRLEIDYLNEKYLLGLPESDEYDTLAGYIFHKHENIPELNEQIVIDKYIFKIIRVSNTRIELIYLTLRHP